MAAGLEAGRGVGARAGGPGTGVETALHARRGLVGRDGDGGGAALGGLGRGARDRKGGRGEVGRPVQDDRVGSGVPAAFTARMTAVCSPARTSVTYQVGPHATQAAPSSRHSIRSAVGEPLTFSRSRDSAEVPEGASTTVVSGGARSVVQRHGSAAPTWPAASTARASNTCAPAPTVTEAAQAPQAPPSSRHSRRAAASSTSSENAGRSSPLRGSGPVAIVTRGAPSTSSPTRPACRPRGPGHGPRLEPVGPVRQRVEARVSAARFHRAPSSRHSTRRRPARTTRRSRRAHFPNGWTARDRRVDARRAHHPGDRGRRRVLVARVVDGHDPERVRAVREVLVADQAVVVEAEPEGLAVERAAGRRPAGELRVGLPGVPATPADVPRLRLELRDAPARVHPSTSAGLTMRESGAVTSTVNDVPRTGPVRPRFTPRTFTEW